MIFSYKNAMNRVNNELNDLVNKLWPEFLKTDTNNKFITKPELEFDLEFKAKRMLERIDFTHPEVKMLSLLYELTFGTFWHTTDNWKDLESKMTEEDRIFYSTIILEQAKIAHTVSGSSAPGYRYGYSWIVRKYNDNTLRQYVSNELLKEAVNRGFWEYVNEYFTLKDDNIPVPLAVFEHYKVIMKYSELLDLRRVEEFWKEPLSGKYEFVTQEYKDALERALPYLSTDSAIKLVVPVIKNIFETTLKYRTWEITPEEQEIQIEKLVAPYKKYLDNSSVKNIFICGIKSAMNRIYDDEFAYEALREIKLYLKYISTDNYTKAKIISDNLKLSENNPVRDIEKLIEINFPIKLLTKKKRNQIESILLNTLGIMAKMVVNPSFKPSNELDYVARKALKKIYGSVPTIKFVQDAFDFGLISEENSKQFIENQIKLYAESKRVPSKDAINAWRKTKIHIPISTESIKMMLRKTEENTKTLEVRTLRTFMRALEKKTKLKTLW